ncbi:MAG: hypothetical protein J7L53_09535 [Deltaproteobacteria bacterium]|nr:hypothetical protein [Deltaproteobacteria bacterium]
MKIDPNMIIGKTLGQTSHQKHVSGGAKFEDILQRIEDASGKDISRISPHGITDMISPPQADKIKSLSISEQALDILDKYNKLLTNPDITLKSLAPIVDDMKIMGKQLNEVSLSLPSDDSLKEIVNDIVSAIDSEVIRFNRGDLIG